MSNGSGSPFDNIAREIIDETHSVSFNYPRSFIYQLTNFDRACDERVKVCPALRDFVPRLASRWSKLH